MYVHYINSYSGRWLTVDTILITRLTCRTPIRLSEMIMIYYANIENFERLSQIWQTWVLSLLNYCEALKGSVGLGLDKISLTSSEIYSRTNHSWYSKAQYNFNRNTKRGMFLDFLKYIRHGYPFLITIVFIFQLFLFTSLF